MDADDCCFLLVVVDVEGGDDLFVAAASDDVDDLPIGAVEGGGASGRTADR